MAQAGQDAKFFTRGKIEVRQLSVSYLILVIYATVQEFRADLQAAETKDKKYVKRKIVLKKIVANITMGNDSRYTSASHRERRCKAHICSSVTIVHGCRAMLGHAASRNKEEYGLPALLFVNLPVPQWSIYSALAMEGRNPIKYILSSPTFSRYGSCDPCAKYDA